MRLSRARAMTAVTKRTTATTTSRCQSGMRLGSTRRASTLVEGERLAAREPLFGAVPERDVIFAELPAEQDLAAAVQAREVDEPPVEVLHLHAEALQLVDDGDELRRG